MFFCFPISMGALTSTIGLLIVIWLATQPSHAVDINVGAGTNINWGTTKADLGDADYTLEGNMQAQSSLLAGLRDMVINAAGELKGENGTIVLKGDFINDKGGAFDAGLSTMIFQMAEQASRLMTGANTFHNLILTDEGNTGAAKELVLQAGVIQLIRNSMEILTTSSTPIRLRSSVAGQPALLNLQPQARQNVGVVEVVDINATGQTICVAPGSRILGNSQGFDASPNCGSTGGGGSSEALKNISYNGLVPTSGIKIGFIVEQATTLAITAESFPGAQAPLPDPVATLTTVQGAPIETDDNCDVDVTASIGRALTTARDACIIRAFDQGAFVVDIRDTGGASGNVLISVTAAAGAPSTLKNISYNGLVPSESINIGFILDQTATVAITAESFPGAQAPLPDPLASLATLQGSQIESDDNCDTDIVSSIGRPLATPRDACIVRALGAGQFVVNISEANAISGNVLLSVTKTP